LRFGYWLVHSVVRLTLTVIAGFKVIGKDNLPPTGSVIVASNHIAFLDPPVIAVSLYREANFAAKMELFKNPIVSRLITYLNAFPVNRSGLDMAALRKSLEALNSNGVLIIFPEGTRSRIGEMLPFKRGIGYFVTKTKAAVLPLYIKGTNTFKKNLFKRGAITVRIGESIHGLADRFTGDDRYERISEEIRKAIVRLKNQAD